MHIVNALRTILDWKDHDYDLSRKLSSLRFATQSFERHLDRLMAIEEHEGYMEVIGHSSPELQSAVGTLQQEHVQLRTTLNDIVHRLDTLSPTDHAGYGKVCAELAAFFDRVDGHNRKETELLARALL